MTWIFKDVEGQSKIKIVIYIFTPPDILLNSLAHAAVPPSVDGSSQCKNVHKNKRLCKHHCPVQAQFYPLQNWKNVSTFGSFLKETEILCLFTNHELCFFSAASFLCCEFFSARFKIKQKYYYQDSKAFSKQVSFVMNIRWVLNICMNSTEQMCALLSFGFRIWVNSSCFIFGCK